MTILCSLLVLAALSIILFGNEAANFVSAHLGLGPVITWTWKILQWPIAFFFLTLVFAIIYYAAPDVEQRHWQWISPGAVIGIVLWLVVSFGFRVYLGIFSNSYSATYGALGAVIILMLWFYVTGAAILTGGEVNAEIENAAARRGEPGAKRKGQKIPQAA